MRISVLAELELWDKLKSSLLYVSELGYTEKLLKDIELPYDFEWAVTK